MNRRRSTGNQARHLADRSTGTTAQVEEAAQVLAETRRKLYTILAEGDPE